MKRVIRSSVYERPIDPPEYDDPEVEDDFQEEVLVSIDAQIHVDVSGDWTFEGPQQGIAWARNPESKDGIWYAEHESNIYIADPSTIAEDINELLVQYVPMDPGIYHVTGYANLIYNVKDLEYYLSDGDRDYIEDSADVQFDFEDSELVNVEITKI